MNKDDNEKIEISAATLPRRDDSLTSWIFKSRKYIYPYDILNAAKKIYPNKKEFKPLTIDQWVKLSDPGDTKELTDILITINSILPKFTEEDISNYLKHESTKPLGLALSIEYRLLDKILVYGDIEQISLFLQEFKISEEEINLLSTDDKIISDIFTRITNKNKVMFTQLTSNYLAIITRNPNIKTPPGSIKKYIEHASFYGNQPDELFKKILENNNIHPVFSEISALFWDPYTRSRKYSSWLEAIRRMDDVATYYSHLENKQAENYFDNLIYINLYLKSKKAYGICY